MSGHVLSCMVDFCECGGLVYIFFFFKQKTAYEMRISDWSSDGCSSDLSLAVQYETILVDVADRIATITLNRPEALNSFTRQMMTEFEHLWKWIAREDDKIGRASCRERVCQYV